MESPANESDWFKVWCASNILKVNEICQRSVNGTVGHAKVTTSGSINSFISFTAEAETSLYYIFSIFSYQSVQLNLRYFKSVPNNDIATGAAPTFIS